MYKLSESLFIHGIYPNNCCRDRDIDANLGYIQLEEFLQVLNSRDLGLQLNEEELLYIAEQVDINVNGWIPLVQVVPQLPALLLAIYKQRAEQAMVMIIASKLIYSEIFFQCSI